MKSLLLSLGAIALGLSLTVGIGSALASSQSSSAGTKVAVANSNLGRILVDSRGHTIYLFAKDRNGRSACSGTCAAYWPPLLTTGKPLATAGARASLLGTTKRADGRLQVTYNHHPLYTFKLDVRKGQTSGEELNDFGGQWDALSAAGTKVEKAAEKNSSTSNPSAGGYGY